MVIGDVPKTEELSRPAEEEGGAWRFSRLEFEKCEIRVRGDVSG